MFCAAKAHAPWLVPPPTAAPAFADRMYRYVCCSARLETETIKQAFVPTDDAFEAEGITNSSVTTLPQPVVQNLLRYHLLEGAVSKEVLAESADFYTVLQVKRKGVASCLFLRTLPACYIRNAFCFPLLPPKHNIPALSGAPFEARSKHATTPFPFHSIPSPLPSSLLTVRAAPVGRSVCAFLPSHNPQVTLDVERNGTLVDGEGNARDVVGEELRASNGYAHAVDGVLFPPDLLSLAQDLNAEGGSFEGVFDIFLAGVTRTGLEPLLTGVNGLYTVSERGTYTRVWIVPEAPYCCVVCVACAVRSVVGWWHSSFWAFARPVGSLACLGFDVPPTSRHAGPCAS